MTLLRLPGVGPDERVYGLRGLQHRAHPDHRRAVQALYALLGANVHVGENTTAALKIYPFHNAFGKTRPEVEHSVEAWLDTIGWSYKIFGPDEDGKGWTDPDFSTWSYHNQTVWIFQPAEAEGSFRDFAYTLAWRVTHEVAHGLVNDELTEKYGTIGRRLGMLGVRKTFTGRGRRPFIAEALTLIHGLRALEWEHRAFIKQRQLLESDFGIEISDGDFRRENHVNMIDAVSRILTSFFSSPGELGIEPQAIDRQEVLARCAGVLFVAAEEMQLISRSERRGCRSTPHCSRGRATEAQALFWWADFLAEMQPSGGRP